ncbi:MAG: UDP-glucose:sterol glucosyltransferase [Betaproteobacteria bacterium]|nr:UDP-glucose:sterol glucosyltransferase [Betaproteobacteria bacterium]
MPSPRHIVLTTIGSYGDLHPMIALGLELQRRGHAVTMATTSMYEAKVRGTGLTYHRLRPDLDIDDPDLVRNLMDPVKGPEYLVRKMFMPHLREMFDDLAAAAAQADFMVAGEVVFAAPLVAEKFSRRWAAAILAPMSFFSIHDPWVMSPLPATRHLHGAPAWVHRALVGAAKWSVRNWGLPVARLRGELGLAPGGHPLFAGKYSPWLNLALFSPVLGRPQADWPVPTVQPGFVYYDRDAAEGGAQAELRAFLDAGPAPIVFTLGSAAVRDARDFFEQSVAAARQLKRRALLLMGENTLKQALPPEIAAFNYAPYSHVLPRAACVVHQGGVGTTAQTLRAGVPQVVVPFGFDQPDNGARIERMGAGRMVLRKDYTAARVAQLLAGLLDYPAPARRAREIARQLQGKDGLRGACDAIEAAMLRETSGASTNGRAP